MCVHIAYVYVVCVCVCVCVFPYHYLSFMQVLSKTIAEAISMEENASLTETERFCRKFNKFFDCFNVRSLAEGLYKLNPDVEPYKSAEDPRLKVLYILFILLLLTTFSFLVTVAKR